jgi:CheY-like chemotaxis protein
MCSILLVEDHPDTQRAFAAILRSWGHTVSTSDSAAGGLSFLDDNKVDVVLSDIGLPDRNGYEFIAEARQRRPQMATIAVSAYFTAADQQRGRDAGFDSILRNQWTCSASTACWKGWVHPPAATATATATAQRRRTNGTIQLVVA